MRIRSSGAWACSSSPGPKPMAGMPCRPHTATALVEKVQWSGTGSRSNRARQVSAPARTSG